MYILHSIIYSTDLCYILVKMLRNVTWFLVLINLVLKTNALWEKEVTCPTQCTCRLEHLSETAIYRFIKKDKKTHAPGDASAENNEVLYEEDSLANEFLEDTSIVRSATCVIDTETEPEALINQLPKNIETITMIQAYDSGNKTVKFSYFTNLENLISLEVIGPNTLNKIIDGHFTCEIDVPLINLKYLNLERVLIKNSKMQIQKFVRKLKDDELTFEYVIQKHDSNLHPLTIVQKGTNEDILPYKKFKEQENMNEVPLFIGFKSLLLLRITNCELKNVHWQMFDSLQNLQYLILERNNLRFIPAFAFYGTPSLKYLSLAHNNLLDIQITDLAGLLELEYLDLSYNNFSQLSELSLPPFPKLKLADFGNNPIGIIFPNTFEVMNTTDSLIIGSDDMALILTTNSFTGLNLLKKLTLNNLNQTLLKRDLFVGMPNLQEFVLTGNITEIEFDAFLEVTTLKKLILNNCQIRNISMDAFIGLEKLQYLDLSKNNLEYLPPGIFDQLSSIKEIYLNGNNIRELPRTIFSKIHAKLIRLNDNPWHCSCEMSEWKPMIINKIKQRNFKSCNDITNNDKAIVCSTENRFVYTYLYDNKIAPKCSEPKQFKNWNVFHAMRKILKCPDYKPKFKKHILKKKILNDLPSTPGPVDSKKIKTESIQNKYPIKNFKNSYLKDQKLARKSKFYHKLNINSVPARDTQTMSNVIV